MSSTTITHNGEPFELREGIFFGMPEDLYHALPCHSSTGFKNLLISAPDFFFNSWLNPLRDEDAEDEDSSEWRKFGKASHTRILEGKKMFDELYCVEFIAPEGCLKTIPDLKNYCAQNGIDTKGSSKWGKSEWVSAVQFANPNVLIHEVEEGKYFRETGGRIQLSEKDMRRIEIAAAMIEHHPELRHCFIGGYAEVTVIWFEDGLWFKARFDYLKPRAVVDLKTFTNKQNKPIDQALYAQMAGLKYHIQCCHYTRAAKKAVQFAATNNWMTYSPTRFGPTSDFIAALAAQTGDHEFFHVWQKKGGAPLARGKKFRRNLSMYACAEASIEQAIALYKKYLSLYGKEIWVDDSSISDYEDALFPTWATEI